MQRFAERKCSELLSNFNEVYVCPITHELFVEPVVADDGHTYERSAIERHFRGSSFRSPLTNEALSTRLLPNHTLKSAVAQYKASLLSDILNILPAAYECRDLSTVKALIHRGLECAGCDAERKALHAHQEQLLKTAEEAEETKVIVAVVDEVLSFGADGAKAALACLEEATLSAVLTLVGDAAKVVVTWELFVRRLWPKMAAVAVGCAERRKALQKRLADVEEVLLADAAEPASELEVGDSEDDYDLFA